VTGDRLGEVRAAFAEVDMLDPKAAFALGLAYGAAIERERVDAEDDAIHRAGAADVSRVVKSVDRWNAARPDPPIVGWGV
jgi:hypothetical protein